MHEFSSTIVPFINTGSLKKQKLRVCFFFASVAITSLISSAFVPTICLFSHPPALDPFVDRKASAYYFSPWQKNQSSISKKQFTYLCTFRLFFHATISHPNPHQGGIGNEHGNIYFSVEVGGEKLKTPVGVAP